MAVETTEDEQAVGTLTASNDRRAAALVANTPSLKTPGVTVTQSEEAPEEIDYGLGNPVAQAAPAHPTTGKVAMKVVQDDQDATPVARFGNPAVQKVILSDGSQAAREIGKLDGGRVTKVEKLATKAPSQTVITEGTSIKETSGGTTGDVTEMHTGDTLEALLPDALVAGASLPKFDWDKSIHWRKRVAAALAYADKPETLKQIFACEEPSVVKHVKSELERKGLVIPA